MSGNVWEWTSDPNSVRGGSWGNLRLDAHVALRLRLVPVSSNFNRGFRVVSPVF
jgi:formylglycine-generating enzyme required for sulfatase activity